MAARFVYIRNFVCSKQSQICEAKNRATKRKKRQRRNQHECKQKDNKEDRRSKTTAKIWQSQQVDNVLAQTVATQSVSQSASLEEGERERADRETARRLSRVLSDFFLEINRKNRRRRQNLINFNLNVVVYLFLLLFFLFTAVSLIFQLSGQACCCQSLSALLLLLPCRRLKTGFGPCAKKRKTKTAKQKLKAAQRCQSVFIFFLLLLCSSHCCL